MSFRPTLFHLVACMVTINLIYAQQVPQVLFGLPFFGNNNNQSGLPFNIGQFLPGGSPKAAPAFPSSFSIPGLQSREVRSADPRHHGDHRSPRVVACNYTEQGPFSCASCRRTLTCFPNNFAVVNKCRNPLRFCNDGFCSYIPGTQCTDNNNSTASDN